MPPTYRKEIKIFATKFASCYLYHMNPGGIERPHYHDGLEIECVLRGSSSTHKPGHCYFRRRGEVHEGINDSPHELVFLTLTIPAESNATTHYPSP